MFQQLTQPDQVPIYALSPLSRYGNSHAVTVTSLSSDLGKLMLGDLLIQWQENPISIDDQLFAVDRIEVETTSDVQLIQSYTLNSFSPKPKISLKFITPVVFRSHGSNMPFPTPDLVFGSLLDRWNSVCDIKLHPDMRTFARECMRISSYRMASQRVNGGDSLFGIFEGGVGDCGYVVWRKDEYWQRISHVLAKFSHFSGIGSRTTIGLGQVRVK